ncbi:MAG: copper resistance protein B [Pseudomonadota bacterium]
MVNKRVYWIVVALLVFGFVHAFAQEACGMDHSQMDHGKMDHGSKDARGEATTSQADSGGDMDHGKMGHDSAQAASPPTVGAGHGSMQGGSAPPDARDPHAYSGGLVFGPDRQLKLADEHSFGSILIDRLEAARTRERTAGRYELEARYGRDYDRAVLKAEGEIEGGRLHEARTELLWGHAVAAYWDTQLGVRYDSGTGPDRGWLAFGVQGLAPYWFEIDATAYVGEQGRTALRLEAKYELLLTQQLVLQPRLEANFYGKKDAEREFGTGLSYLTAGIRLRYEIRREFAPYVGIEWARRFGGTADFARADGKDTEETRLLAGLRFWF